MQYKNLFLSGLLLALSLPSNVFGHRISYYEGAPSFATPGACGTDHIYDYYVALNAPEFDSDRPKSCGKCVKVVYKNKYIVGRISDRCAGCVHGSLDIAPKMFDHFVGRSHREEVGIVDATWSYVSCDEYGKSGECSGSGCGESEHKTTTKTTTTTTTTTVAESTTTETKSSTETHIVGTPVSKKSKDEKTAEAPVEINPVFSSEKSAPKEEKKEGGNAATYAIPATGAVIGAAGIGLLYLKRENKYDNISSQIKNITRSITTRGTSLGRSVTRSLTTRGTSLGRSVTRSLKIKRPAPPTLPTTNVASEMVDATQPIEIIN